jgi:transposase
MAFVGLLPSEHSSGTKQARGAITKTGNTHLRRVLVEAAWHYRHRPFVGAALRRRQREAPAGRRPRAHRLRLGGADPVSRSADFGKENPRPLYAIPDGRR